MTRSTIAILVLALLGSAGQATAGSLLPPGKAARSPAVPERPDATCAAYGPGFHKIEGSDSCVKLSGSVRIETGINTSGSSFFPSTR